MLRKLFLMALFWLIALCKSCVNALEKLCAECVKVLDVLPAPGFMHKLYTAFTRVFKQPKGGFESAKLRCLVGSY